MEQGKKGFSLMYNSDQLSKCDLDPPLDLNRHLSNDWAHFLSIWKIVLEGNFQGKVHAFRAELR